MRTRGKVARGGRLGAPGGRAGAGWPRAPQFPDRSVHAHDIVRRGGFVQTVDVLRDQRELRKPPAPRRQHVVRAVRPARRDQAAPPLVPLPDQLRVARERLRRGELLGPEIPPQPAGTAKRGHPARRRDARAGQDGDPRFAREPRRDHRVQFTFLVQYHIKQYDLEQGALEIQYIEEFFGEFPRKKAATEIVRRLSGRAHLILLATAPLPDDPGTVVPVSFKVAHEIKIPETEPKLVDLMHRLHDHEQFPGRRVLYTWIGGTRRDWRGLGFFRALTEQQELWAISQGFDEIIVKTKNKFYDMRGTLDHLRFEVVKYERNAADNAESKVYLSKKLLPEMIRAHRSAKTVVEIGN